MMMKMRDETGPCARVCAGESLFCSLVPRSHLKGKKAKNPNLLLAPQWPLLPFPRPPGLLGLLGLLGLSFAS